MTEVAQIFGLLFSAVRIMHFVILTNNGLNYITTLLGGTFKNSSGHPEGGS
jgi:hypothetical protein